MKSPGSRMPVPLGKLVLFTGVAGTGTCALLYYLIQKTFSRASYYQLALEQLRSHPEALEALGTPLQVHHLRLTDKDNFVDIADAKLKIPVSGPRAEGHLYVNSSRDAPFKRWNLQEVFLELKDGQQIPVFKPGGENGDDAGEKGVKVTSSLPAAPPTPTCPAFSPRASGRSAGMLVSVSLSLGHNKCFCGF
ncbi:cytochrome c oxidase assembly factor 1 homolog isoform X1 [Camelus ferus]|uniref:Cytochrome c oxidase assembly factor 1 homolog isoform X1 n=1 Tax=Camelus ferus TaxID=419612 RepID=A0A8B8TD55_CAMFR|nr:cytochrome c oxidase assembly factor 1 homolog isoform X1 [Camelus ferus]